MSVYSKTTNRLPACSHDPGALEPVLSWIDGRFGPMRSLRGIRFAKPDPPWWLYTCQLARPLGEFFTDYEMSATGSSLDPSEALRRTLGEAVERYNELNAMKFVETRFAVMPLEHPLYGKFPLCAEFEDCDSSLKQPPTEKLTQVKVKYLADDREIWIPASYVYLNFLPEPDEPIVGKSITTGSAFHSDLFKAVWSGLLECAERDAIMLTWWNRNPAPRILISERCSNAKLGERVRLVRNAGVQLYLFDISTDFNLPTVFCLLKRNSFPYWAAGASCNENPITACMKSIDEAGAIMWHQNKKVKRKIPSFEKFGWIESLADRSELYLHWKNCPALDFLVNSSNCISESDFLNKGRWSAPSDFEELRGFARLMAKHDLTALYCETTTDDVSELGHCARSIVPEMLPLSVHHSESFLATARLAKAAGKQSLSKDDLNPYPHPFA